MRFLHSNPPLSLLVATTFIISSTTLSVSAAAAPVVEMNFLRHRNLQESSTSPTTVAQCEPCPVCDAASITPEAKKEKIKLRFLVADRSFAQLKVMLDQVADDYTRKLGPDVAPEITVQSVPTLSELEREVKFDVLSGASQFDGYIITPLWIGELANGLFETQNFMKEYSATEEGYSYWTDILLFYREVISSYDNKLYLFPFDGDVISMFYRRDLLEEYKKDVPKTWDEYNELAAFFHGKTDTILNEDGTANRTVTLSGSCIGRAPECGGPYWAQTVLGTMTQVKGTYEGSLLDSSNIQPLLAAAMEETLRLQGEQTKYGHPTEFDGCVGIHVDSMNAGECVLTYNWGNSFSDHVRPGSTVRGKLGVAPTPGSPLVLNRETGLLEECTKESCPYAVLDQKTGALINQSPYGAYGGFSGAVSGSISEAHQIAAAEFFAYATSAAKAIKYVIPDANNPEANNVPTGMDPYSKSMLDVEQWTSRGFDQNSAKEYKYAIESQLDSPNVVIDLRMPKAAAFMSTLDAVITKYCNDTKFNLVDEDSAAVRAVLTDELAQEWQDTVSDYDSAEDREDGALLELYQRDRGVYVPRSILSLEADDGMNTGVIVAIVVCITVVIAILIFVAAYFVKKRGEDARGDMWYVNPNDVVDTKEILGRGSFGVVTKGFLRGTPVALKHAKGWEPDIVTAQPVEAEQDSTTTESKSRAMRGDPNRLSQASSLSDRESEMDASATVGATLLTETVSGGGFFLSRGKPKQQCADESLRSELLLLVNLRHDNIVQTLGASQDDKKKQLVLILQYMENGPIRNVLKDPDSGVAGTAGMSLEIQWALQVARGVNYLHTIPPPSGPMVHADIKSSNVLLDSSYNANISDFGLATKTMKGLWGAIQRSTKSNNPRGSILWMAPEVLNGADPSPASDVYSYSMFLVELMTRNRPYGMKAYEVRANGMEKRFSEVSLGTEYDRVRQSSFGSGEEKIESGDAVAPDLNGGPSFIDSSPAPQPTTPEAQPNALGEKQDLKPKRTGAKFRSVSWSLNGDESTVGSPDTAINGDRSKNTLAKSASKLTPGSKEFYAIINGDKLDMDAIVNRVKDLALDPPFRPTLPDGAPQVLIDICTECWQKNPKRRPTMKEVEERLAAVVSSTSLTKQLMKRGSVFDSILPPDVQDKLARGEKIKPQNHEEVTVLFSDIVGFTSISSALTAEETGDLIFRLFTKFEDLCKANGVKKLDVIGDAFLGVVGVPNAVPDHANRAARFSLNAITAAQETIICPAKPELGYAKVRFGLASGSAVATVIGTREHPKYTLFGDAVNTASRMESTSLPNKVQVTQDTANLILLHGEGGGIKVVSRGKMDVKGKGEMETFFLEDSYE